MQDYMFWVNLRITWSWGKQGNDCMCLLSTRYIVTVILLTPCHHITLRLWCYKSKAQRNLAFLYWFFLPSVTSAWVWCWDFIYFSWNPLHKTLLRCSSDLIFLSRGIIWVTDPSGSWRSCNWHTIMMSRILILKSDLAHFRKTEQAVKLFWAKTAIISTAAKQIHWKSSWALFFSDIQCSS